MEPAVLRLLLVSIWTWAPLVSAVLQSKLVPQLPSGFTAKGQVQHEPRMGVLQKKLQPVMPPGVGGMMPNPQAVPSGGFVMVPSANPGPFFGRNPWEMLKFYQLWQLYLQNSHTNDQRGAQSPSFLTSRSPYLWKPRERHSQQESSGAQHSQHTPGGVESGRGCRRCGGVQPSQASRTNIPIVSEQHPSRFQQWWSQQGLSGQNQGSGTNEGLSSSSSSPEGGKANLKLPAGLSNKQQVWGQSGRPNEQNGGQQSSYSPPGNVENFAWLQKYQSGQSSKYPPRFQQVSQEGSVKKPSQNPNVPHGYQGWSFNHHIGQQNTGQSSSSPSSARVTGSLSSKVYPFKPQGSQPGSETSGPQQVVQQSSQTTPRKFPIIFYSRYHGWNTNYPSFQHQGGYPGQSQHQGQTSPASNMPKPRPPLTPDPKHYGHNHYVYQGRYQQLSSHSGQRDWNALSLASPLQDMESAEQNKPNNGYQAWGLRIPVHQSGQGQANMQNGGQQSSYSSGRQVSSEKQSQQSTLKPPQSNHLQPNTGHQHFPHSKTQNEEKPSQWLQVRPQKQEMSPKQSENPPNEGSAKFYKVPSRLILHNIPSRTDSQDEKPQRNSAFWQQVYSKPEQQSYGAKQSPGDEKSITVPPLGSDSIVSGSVFSKRQ